MIKDEIPDQEFYWSVDQEFYSWLGIQKFKLAWVTDKFIREFNCSCLKQELFWFHQRIFSREWKFAKKREDVQDAAIQSLAMKGYHESSIS